MGRETVARADHYIEQVIAGFVQEALGHAKRRYPSSWGLKVGALLAGAQRGIELGALDFARNEVEREFAEREAKQAQEPAPCNPSPSAPPCTKPGCAVLHHFEADAKPYRPGDIIDRGVKPWRPTTGPC